MPTPRTPPGEFISNLDCKVNLIQTTMCSVIHCAAKKLIRIIAMLCTRLPVFFPPFAPILISLQVNCPPHLHEITLFHILSLVLWLFPVARLALIVFTVLLCQLWAAVFSPSILTSGSHCSFSAVRLCIIYTITTGKWKQSWVWEKVSSGKCDGIPKEWHFQLNQSRLTKPWRFLLYTVLGRQYSAHVSENSKYLQEGNDVGDKCNYLSRAQFTRLLPQMQH